MLSAQIVPCHLGNLLADSLNQESGRVYARAMVSHYRAYRHSGHWLSPYQLKRLCDFYDHEAGVEALLHSHSVDAAQEGFPKACKVAKVQKKLGLDAKNLIGGSAIERPSGRQAPSL